MLRNNNYYIVLQWIWFSQAIKSHRVFTMKVLFHIIIKVFQFFGMCPISLNFSDSKAKVTYDRNVFLVFWSLLNIFSLSAYIIVIGVYYEFVLNKLNSIGKFSTITKGGTVLITHLIILCESLLTMNNQGYLWTKAKCVDNTFDKMGIATDIKKSQFYKKISLKFFSYQLFAWISEIVVIFQVQDNLSWKLFNYATLISVMVSRTRHLHHALYIGMRLCHASLAFRTNSQIFKFIKDMITADFCAIKSQLEMLLETTTKSTEEFEIMKSKNAANSLDKIKLAKTAYSHLYEISVQLNNIVSLSQLVNLTQGFIYLTSDLHSLYMKLYVNDFGALPGL